MDIETALGIAVEAHKGQKDLAGAPYILHPLHVMEGVGTEDEKVVALLHDVLEDTDMTLGELATLGLTEKQIGPLMHLTKASGQSYMDYIKDIYPDKVARNVKIQDLLHNMNISRLPESYFNENKDRIAERLKKYIVALCYLLTGEVVEPTKKGKCNKLFYILTHKPRTCYERIEDFCWMIGYSFEYKSITNFRVMLRWLNEGFINDLHYGDK